MGPSESPESREVGQRRPHHGYGTDRGTPPTRAADQGDAEPGDGKIQPSAGGEPRTAASACYKTGNQCQIEPANSPQRPVMVTTAQ